MSPVLCGGNNHNVHAADGDEAADHRDLLTGLITFLFTDVEGSTRLLTALGEDYASVHSDHQRLVRAALTAHNGVEVSTEGDSFFAVFGSAREAIEAAAEAQLALARHPWPEDRQLRVRMGLHTGHAVKAADNYVGIDVNRAARISAAGHGGQVLVSETVRRQVGHQLPDGLVFHDLGRHRLKDIGVEHLWQLDIEGLPYSFGRLRSLEEHPSNLPPDLTELIDREAERRALAALVVQSSLTTVTGPGGIGKSRLAIAVARELVEQFPDGVFYLDLAPIEHADIAASELATVLGARVDPRSDPSDIVIDHLRDRQVQLVLETIDRVQGMSELVARLVTQCSRSHILLTGRSPLHLAAEREFPVGPLALPDAHRPGDVDDIVASPAVQLFANRAQAARPDFAVDRANAPAILEICARLDGLPLAIELAAARIKLLNPDAILARLARLLPLLSGGARDLPDRQRTLRDTIAWSYGLLEPEERSMLQRLSVYAASFDLAGAQAVAGRSGTSDIDALGVLERLVDRSMVTTVQTSEEPRFRLLGAIREFGLEALEETGDAVAAREAHIRHWIEYSRALRPGLEGPEDLTVLARLEREIDEYRSALEWSISAAPDLALALTAGLGRFWWLRGHPGEGQRWLEDALAAAPEGEAVDRAEALTWLGVLLDDIRQSKRAAEHLEEALALYRRLEDERGIARTLNSLGGAMRSLGDLDRAQILLDESLQRKRRFGDERGMAATLSNLALVASDRGNFELARQLLEDALVLDRASGGPAAVAYTMANLGSVLVDAGRIGDGVQSIRTVLPTIAEIGDVELIADCLGSLGRAAMASGDPGRAARLLVMARALREREGIPPGRPEETRARKTLAAAEAELGPTAMAAALDEGQAVDGDAAVAYALAVA
jgi:predicted ATPase/class 3 adenylate cyclase